MFKRLKNSMFGRKSVSGYSNKRNNAQLQELAKTEFGKDWQYAYYHMLQTGNMPKNTGDVVR
jgi:hypothetical protein